MLYILKFNLYKVVLNTFLAHSGLESHASCNSVMLVNDNLICDEFKATTDSQSLGNFRLFLGIDVLMTSSDPNTNLVSTYFLY